MQIGAWGCLRGFTACERQKLFLLSLLAFAQSWCHVPQLANHLILGRPRVARRRGCCPSVVCGNKANQCRVVHFRLYFDQMRVLLRRTAFRLSAQEALLNVVIKVTTLSCEFGTYHPVPPDPP